MILLLGTGGLPNSSSIVFAVWAFLLLSVIRTERPAHKFLPPRHRITSQPCGGILVVNT